MEATQWWTVPVPKSLITDTSLEPGARHLYMVLCSLVNGTETVRLSAQQLLRLCGLVNRTVLSRYVAGLARAGWLEVEPGSGQRPAGYRLTAPTGPSPVRVPVSLIRHADLSVAAKNLYATLLAYRAADAQAVTMSRLQLVAAAGLGSDNTLRNARRQLSEAGWLRVVRDAKLNVFTYQLLDPHLRARQTVQQRAERRLAEAKYVGELLMQYMLTTLVDDSDYIDNVRPSILLNPLTGEPLEFDRWYRTAGVAFEFNGPQHTGPTAVFPDTNRAKMQMIRDLLKEGLAAKHGIHLLAVTPGELTFEQLRQKIGAMLPLRKLRLEDPLVASLNTTSRRYVRSVRRANL